MREICVTHLNPIYSKQYLKPSFHCVFLTLKRKSLLAREKKTEATIKQEICLVLCKRTRVVIQIFVL